MAEQAPPDPAGRLVDTLLEEGEAVDEGVFTLDAAAAARKLAAFTHGDRNRYLLPIVEGLHRLGAREIQVETVDEDLRIRAFGLRLREPERDLAQIHGYALGRSEHEEGRGLGRLALGLDMVLGNGSTERALLRYFNTGVSLEFEFRHGQAPTLRRVTPKVLGELCVELDHPWLRSLVDDGQKTALAALRHAALRSPRRITLDGRLISQVERDWFDTVTGEGPGYRFSAGLEQGRELADSVVELWTGGLSFSKLAFEGVAFTAVLELDDPRRDLTGMGIVHDEVVAAALVEIDAARLELLERLDRADADWSPEQRPERWSLHR
ncbi:MAG: hypothetical protein KC457_32605, partial [Myxococcales bacterium]|nr:hypothetical protein [Myxococcales bacterium]